MLLRPGAPLCSVVAALLLAAACTAEDRGPRTHEADAARADAEPGAPDAIVTLGDAGPGRDAAPADATVSLDSTLDPEASVTDAAPPRDARPRRDALLPIDARVVPTDFAPPLDAGADAQADAGADAMTSPAPTASLVGVVGGAGVGHTARFRLSLTVGGLAPTAERRTDRYRARFGVGLLTPPPAPGAP